MKFIGKKCNRVRNESNPLRPAKAWFIDRRKDLTCVRCTGKSHTGTYFVKRDRGEKKRREESRRPTGKRKGIDRRKGKTARPPGGVKGNAVPTILEGVA